MQPQIRGSIRSSGKQTPVTLLSYESCVQEVLQGHVERLQQKVAVRLAQVTVSATRKGKCHISERSEMPSFGGNFTQPCITTGTQQHDASRQFRIIKCL